MQRLRVVRVSVQWVCGHSRHVYVAMRRRYALASNLARVTNIGPRFRAAGLLLLLLQAVRRGRAADAAERRLAAAQVACDYM